MKGIFIVFFLSLILVSGCVAVQKSSDDEKYVKTADEYFSLLNQSGPAGNSHTAEQKWAGDMKILSSTYYQKVSELQVSSQLEPSKNSFLQAQKEMEAVADFMLGPLYPKMHVMDAGTTLSNDEELKIREFYQHQDNAVSFLKKALDSKICVSVREEYANLTSACKSF